MTIITPEMTDNVTLLHRASDTLNDLSKYPQAYLTKVASGVLKPPGRRTTMWSVLAYESVLLHGVEPASKAPDVLKNFSEYFLNTFPYPAQIRKDPFWRTSIIHAAGVLRHLCRIYGGSSLAAVLGRLDAEYAPCKKICESTLTVTVTNGDAWYLTFCTLLAYELADSYMATHPSCVKHAKRACRDLEHHLSLHHAHSAVSDRMRLAVSCAIASRGFSAGSTTDPSLLLQIASAAEICFSPPSGYLGKRFVQNTRPDGILHNLPWEELMILSTVPTKYLPQNMNVFGKVLDYFAERQVLTPWGDTALCEESSPYFPAYAPYFTAYGIVLTASIIRILKSRLRKQIRQMVERVDPTYVIDADDNSKELMTFDKYLETYEETKAFVLERVPDKQPDFQARFASFNTMLFFGPPGTGKTTFVEALLDRFKTKKLSASAYVGGHDSGWLAITLTPSMFLVDDSFTNILKNVEDVFRVILSVDHCVFLFDEAEDLARKRNAEDQRFGRMFTAAMLVHLNRLKNGKSIYILATNFIEMMDEAAVRKGRFSIRKGIGWVNERELDNVINKHFLLVPALYHAQLKTQLNGRTAAELKDIAKHLSERTKHGTSAVDWAKLISEFAIAYKPYISDDLRQKHKRNCAAYDDAVAF